MIQTVVFAALFSLPVWAFGQGTGLASAPVLTLERAVALALENNRLLKNAALEHEKAGDRAAAMRTRRLPSMTFNLLGSQLLTEINFEFKQGVFGTFPGTGPIPGRDTRITTPRRPNAYVVGQVVQPISQLYKIGLGVQLQETARETERQKLRSEQQALINDVKRAYYMILQTESALEASDESLRHYRELDRLVRSHVLQRVALEFESLDVKARLAQEEYTSVTLRNTLASRKEQLNLLLARDIRTDFRLEGAPPADLFEFDLQAAQSRALENRPEVREARLKVQQAEQDYRLKRAESIPEVSLSLLYLSPFRIEALPKNITAVGLQVSWEPFDWGRKKRELEEKNRTIEQAENGLREVEARILVDLNSRFRKLGETRALLPVVQTAQESAREKLRVVQSRYALEASLLKDVLQAQSALGEANHNHQQAVLAYWAARADFEKALGEDK